MAIAYVNSAGGAQSTTSSTTLQVTYSSQGKTLLVASICVFANTSVSSVTDSAGNTWHAIRAAVGTAPRVEFWKTDSAQSAAVTSVTCTLSASGTKFAMVVGEYSGVAYAAGQNNGGAGTSTTQTQSLTIVEANDWVIGTVGCSSTTAFVQQTGNLRNTAVTSATNPAQVGLLDNTSGSVGSVTVATNTGSTGVNYGIMTNELRLLAATKDTLSMSDAPRSGYGDILPGDSLNNWLDQLPVGVGLGLSDNTLNNWLDALGVGRSYGDSLNNWADALQKQYSGFNFGEQLNMQDALLVAAPAVIAVGDSLNFWADAIPPAAGFDIGARVSQEVLLGLVSGSPSASVSQEVILLIAKKIVFQSAQPKITVNT